MRVWVNDTCTKCEIKRPEDKPLRWLSTALKKLEHRIVSSLFFKRKIIRILVTDVVVYVQAINTFAGFFQLETAERVMILCGVSVAAGKQKSIGLQHAGVF